MIDLKNHKAKLKQLYIPLLQKVNESNFANDSCVFCAQWGEHYFDLEPKQRIMFVGRSVNGWINNSLDADVLFGEGNDRIFNRGDQMRWVHEREHDKNKYNTKRSAFWRVVKKTTEAHLPKINDDWFSHVVWSNLFKVSPNNTGMNPNPKLRDLQREDCISIFRKELEIFKPEIVIMFTGGWEGFFLKNLMGLDKQNNLPEPDNVIPWSKYETKQYFVDNLNIIVTEHPMGKKEELHINALLELIA